MEEVRPDTPFGPTQRHHRHRHAGRACGSPSSPATAAATASCPPSCPSRANIYALKTLGVEFIIGVSAVGSLREEIAPLDLVVPDQLIDRTRRGPAPSSATGWSPTSPSPSRSAPSSAASSTRRRREAGATVHDGGTLRGHGGAGLLHPGRVGTSTAPGAPDLIGMTALPEAKLAREAEICYATLACVTDYDCWHESYAVGDGGDDRPAT